MDNDHSEQVDAILDAAQREQEYWARRARAVRLRLFAAMVLLVLAFGVLMTSLVLTVVAP